MGQAISEQAKQAIEPHKGHDIYLIFCFLLLQQYTTTHTLLFYPIIFIFNAEKQRELCRFVWSFQGFSLPLPVSTTEPRVREHYNSHRF